MISKIKSIQGNVCEKTSTQGNFTKVFLAEARSKADKTLIDFKYDIVIPEELVKDGAVEFSGKSIYFVK